MNIWTTTIAASCLLAGIVPQDPAGTPTRGKLVRVAPARQADPGATSTSDFGAFRSRLAADDLDERERAFDELVAAAQRDPALWKELEDRARDLSDRELAWTARLALRELRAGASRLRLSPWGDRHQFGRGFPEGVFELDFFDLDGLDPQGLVERFQRRFDALEPGAADASSRFESVQLQMNDDGVTCKVTKRVDGQEVTEEFTAKTLEELLEAHPELREHVAVPSLDPQRFFGGRFAPFDRGLPSVRPDALRTDVLGVEVAPLTPDESRSLSLEAGQGLRIERVVPGTIASQLGLQRGHVLIEIDGQPIRTREDITSRLANRAPDAQLEVTLIDRWGQERKRVWKPAAAKQI